MDQLLERVPAAMVRPKQWPAVILQVKHTHTDYSQRACCKELIMDTERVPIGASLQLYSAAG